MKRYSKSLLNPWKNNSKHWWIILEFCKAWGGRILPKIDAAGSRVSACVDCGEVVGQGVSNSVQSSDSNNKIQIKDEENDIQSLPIEKEQCSKCCLLYTSPSPRD